MLLVARARVRAHTRHTHPNPAQGRETYTPKTKDAKRAAPHPPTPTQPPSHRHDPQLQMALLCVFERISPSSRKSTMALSFAQRERCIFFFYIATPPSHSDIHNVPCLPPFI